MRFVLVLSFLVSAACGQATKEIVIVVDKEARTGIAEALKRGATQAVAETKFEGVSIVLSDPASAATKGAHAAAVAFFVFAPPDKSVAVYKEAETRKICAVDLGAARLPRAASLRGSLESQVRSAAWWVFGPFAHHHVGLIVFNHPEDQAFAKLFAAEAKASYPKKTVAALRHVNGTKADSVAKELDKDVQEGVTAFLVSGTAAEGRLIADAARLLPVKPGVILAAAALGFEPRDRKDPSLPGGFPDGTVVMDLDLPPPPVFGEFENAVETLAMLDAGGPWALAAFDAVVALKKSAAAAATNPSISFDASLGVRGASFGKDARLLSHTTLMASDGRLVPCAPVDPKNPLTRPAMTPYDPEEGLGSFSRWSALTFKTNPDTTRCVFGFTDGKVRSIEEDLRKLKLGSGGKYPMLDHLVREKLLVRTMSVTAEKFGLRSDGSLVPGKSFQISFVARPDKVKTKKTWPCYVAGDDPEAGGRAFGSHCFIYSTFIQRTIFDKFDLLDDAINPSDLPFLTGVGADEASYTLGSRPDTIYRLIDNYAGSMGLTAAHEIGHLAGLGHDEDDPNGLMNVKEGAGIRYEDGHFTPTNEAALEKSLGRTPDKRKP